MRSACRQHVRSTRPDGLLIAVFAAMILISIGTTARAATITVSTLADPTGSAGTCSLHDAITAANTKVATNNCAAGTGNDTIDFSVPGTVSLAGTLPAIKNTLTIDGSGQAIIISANSIFRLMVVNTGATLNLQFLTLTKGTEASMTSDSQGGAVLNNGTLTIANCTVSNNKAAGALSGSMLDGQGGAIFNAGTLTIYDSTFASNQATGGNASGLPGSGLWRRHL